MNLTVMFVFFQTVRRMMGLFLLKTRLCRLRPTHSDFFKLINGWQPETFRTETQRSCLKPINCPLTSLKGPVRDSTEQRPAGKTGDYRKRKARADAAQRPNILETMGKRATLGERSKQDNSNILSKRNHSVFLSGRDFRKAL